MSRPRYEVARGGDDAAQSTYRARRRRARTIVGDYHKEQFGAPLQYVREDVALFDGGEIDVFELDEVIERYQRAARKVWASCGSSGSDWERSAHWRSCAKTARCRTDRRWPPTANPDAAPSEEAHINGGPAKRMLNSVS